MIEFGGSAVAGPTIITTNREANRRGIEYAAPRVPVDVDELPLALEWNPAQPFDDVTLYSQPTAPRDARRPIRPVFDETILMHCNPVCGAG